ncbi:YqgQ family protein [Lactovum miscens]|uniref:Uncharacterized protein YqgQ n=1 Tax=Lactovum miscens TaxID=190387 RepID=A0A841C928_9LACT|nr:YqgQ family protein [Lactovum miscens]MBB5888061.1 uncharacterized protein YqgQ [Lactovum miscens]
MQSLFDVQEWMKKFGYINLMPNRLDAIYFMKLELTELKKRGIIKDNDPELFTANLILRREARIEEDKEKDLKSN